MDIEKGTALNMDYKAVTEEYYSAWLTDSPRFISDNSERISYIYFEDRNRIQEGYSCRFDVIAWIQDGRTVISYGDQGKSGIDELKERLTADMDSSRVAAIISDVYGRDISHRIKFMYVGGDNVSHMARILTPSDYSEYLSFFKKVNPACANTDWVEDYFNEMAESGLCCGVFVNGELVSCTDAPEVPYMGDMTQEIGINTLAWHRGKGYATECCILCAESIIQSGKCPLWSCAASNIASFKLAEKVGFVKYADFLTVTV